VCLFMHRSCFSDLSVNQLHSNTYLLLGTDLFPIFISSIKKFRPYDFCLWWFRPSLISFLNWRLSLSENLDKMSHSRREYVMCGSLCHSCLGLY